MTNITKKKRIPTIKKTTPTITNTKKWMRTGYTIFYKRQITSRSYMKLNNDKKISSKKQKQMLKQTCLKIQRESMSLNIKNKSCYKQMIDIVNNKTIKKDVEPIESYYRHKVRNIYKQGPNKHKNIVQRQHISLR